MKGTPSFDDIFAVMSAASVGDTKTRVALPDDPQLDDLATRFAIAVNLLLDDLHFRAAERERTVEILRQREQQLSSIYETAADVIFYLAVEKDGRYRFISVNQAFLSTTGLAYEQVVGKLVDEVIPDPSLTLVLGKYGEAIHEKRSVRWEETSDYPTGTLTGEVSVAPVFDDAGNCTHLVGAVHDITERKRAEEAIGKLNIELEQRVIQRTAELEVANQELETFSYSVAHDLRTPLRAIDGFSQAVLDDYADKIDMEGQEHLRDIRQSAQQMARLIDDLLMLSQVTRSELRRESVDLTALARLVLARLQKNEPERRVEFIISDGLVVEADMHLMGIVLENLLGNAWKFTGKRPIARIELDTQEKEEHMVYFVRDNGAGFEMKYANKLFGAFQRLHSATEFDGTGIGLATVRRIIQRHGGEVWAEGEVNQGATIYFTLNAATQ